MALDVNISRHIKFYSGHPELARDLHMEDPYHGGPSQARDDSYFWINFAELAAIVDKFQRLCQNAASLN